MGQREGHHRRRVSPFCRAQDAERQCKDHRHHSRAYVSAHLTRRLKLPQTMSLSKASAVSLVLASLAITPAAVATIMITRGMLQAAHPEVPATVAAFVSGLVMQRLWLALADIDVAVFYTESAAGGDSL